MPTAIQAEETCHNHHLGSENDESDSGTTSSSSGNGKIADPSGVNITGPGVNPPNTLNPQTSQPPLSTVLENAQADLEEQNASLTCPDGGFQAWLVVLGSFCAQGATFGLINTAAVFESYFKANQLKDHSNSEIGWIFSLYLFLVFFVGVQVGPVFDRHGPRLLLAGGSVCVVSSLMLLSISKTYYQIILTYSILGGVGGAMLNGPAYGAIAHFFDARRGLATGITTTAGGFGGIVFPLLLQFLLGENGVGFAWSCRILGFILTALCVVANLLIRARNQTRSMSHDGCTNKGVSSVWPDFTIFRDKRFAMSSLGVFFMEFGLFVPLTYIVSYSEARGLSTTESFTVLSLLNAGSVFGRFLPGLLADKIGRFNVIIMTIALCAATVLGLWVPSASSKAIIIVFAVTFGFASGSNLGLVPVCIGQLCALHNYGRFYSTAQMFASFATLASVPIGGALLGNGDTSNDWLGLNLFAGFSYVVALGCFAYARVLAIGWQPLAIF